MPKLVIFIVAGIILMAGGGITVMQQMEIGPFASDEPKAGTDKGQKDRKKQPVILRSVVMEPLLIPIIQGDKVKLNLQLDIEIKIPENREAKLQEKMPILKDAYIRDLFSFIPRHLRKNKELDENTLKRRLKSVGQRTIGNGIIHSVVIKNYSEAKKGTEEAKAGTEKEKNGEKPKEPLSPPKK